MPMNPADMNPGQPEDISVAAVVTRGTATVTTARSSWRVLRHPPVQDLEYTATIGTGGA
jgi:hypothetical protein